MLIHQQHPALKQLKKNHSHHQHHKKEKAPKQEVIEFVVHRQTVKFNDGSTWKMMVIIGERKLKPPGPTETNKASDDKALLNDYDGN